MKVQGDYKRSGLSTTPWWILTNPGGLRCIVDKQRMEFSILFNWTSPFPDLKAASTRTFFQDIANHEHTAREQSDQVHIVYHYTKVRGVARSFLMLKPGRNIWRIQRSG